MKKFEKIRVVRKDPGQAPVVKEIENTLAMFQHEVGGYLEMYRPGIMSPQFGINVYVDEDGIAKGKAFNPTSITPEVVGTILVTKAVNDGEGSLSEGEAQTVVEMLRV
jgi:hypothetical protein